MRKWLSAAALVVTCIYVQSVLSFRSVLASRNSSGTMSQINGPYIAGTTISSSVINARFADIEAELTDSLSRSAKGGMTAALKVSDGTVAAPAISFTNEAGTGLYRIGATDVGFAVNGTKKLELTSSLFTMTPNATFSGTLGVTSDFSVNTNKFTVAASTGNTTLAGTLLSSISGSGSGTHFSTLQASLANASAANWFLGKAESSNNSLGFAYVPNATAANSQGFIGIYGHNTITLDGNDAVSFAGAVTAASLKIGSSGTSISSSTTGTVSWTPGTLSAQTCSGNNITMAGATTGAPCALGPPSLSVTGIVMTCAITSATQCAVNVCNPTAGNQTAPSGTYTCRVFNP